MPFLIAVFVVGVLGSYFIRGCNDESAKSGTDNTQYYELKRLSERSVKGVLVDPGSAEFRGFFPGEAGGYSIACGEVNAKNSLGGYTGFSRYVSAGGDTATIEGVSDEFQEVWMEFCEPYIHRKPSN